MRLKYNIDTKIIFTIGDPLEHSSSPYLNNSIYDYANVNAVNLPIVVKKGNLRQFVEAAKSLNIAGFDVTTPHKSDIIEYLDECDETSRKYRCVNIVKNIGGKLVGKGIDGKGFILAVEKKFGPIKNFDALIIGAGSVAGLIVDELVCNGINNVVIANRTLSKAEAIAETVRSYRGKNCVATGLDPYIIKDYASKSSIIVQCTTLGNNINSQFESLDFLQYAPKTCVAADLLYPEPQFYREATRLGLRPINGEQMMIMQIPEKLNFYFSKTIDQSFEYEAKEAIGISQVMKRLRNEYRQMS